MEKFVYSWSSGKDSALGLYEIQKQEGAKPDFLLTTVTEDYDRVSMHGVRRELLEEQAGSMGTPLRTITIPASCTNKIYEDIMGKEMERLAGKEIYRVAFADIYLEDLRKYREENLSRAGMEALFPLWGRDTARLARLFVELQFKAVVTCVDGQVLSGELAGRDYDLEFIEGLPQGVDPCGENGEFHTFVFDGPVFSRPVCFRRGEVVKRDGRFFFQELVPESEDEGPRQRVPGAMHAVSGGDDSGG